MSEPVYHRNRAIRLKLARAFIAKHPGCTTTEIKVEVAVSHHDLIRLSALKLARFTQKPEPGMVRGKKMVQRWYVVAMESLPSGDQTT